MGAPSLDLTEPTSELILERLKRTVTEIKNVDTGYRKLYHEYQAHGVPDGKLKTETKALLTSLGKAMEDLSSIDVSFRQPEDSMSKATNNTISYAYYQLMRARLDIYTDDLRNRLLRLYETGTDSTIDSVQ